MPSNPILRPRAARGARPRRAVRRWWALLPAGLTASALAGQADVLEARLTRTGPDTYRIAVTVAHADSGWEHYADRWEVLDPRGQVLATRVLYHPHEDEQPFTRLLSGVHIGPGVTQISVRARDSVHGYGGRVITVAVPRGDP